MRPCTGVVASSWRLPISTTSASTPPGRGGRAAAERGERQGPPVVTGTGKHLAALLPANPVRRLEPLGAHRHARGLELRDGPADSLGGPSEPLSRWPTRSVRSVTAARVAPSVSARPAMASKGDGAAVGDAARAEHEHERTDHGEHVHAIEWAAQCSSPPCSSRSPSLRLRPSSAGERTRREAPPTSSSRPPGHLRGFEAELAGAAREAPGPDRAARPGPLRQLLPLLDRGDFDVAINGIEAAEEKRACLRARPPVLRRPGAPHRPPQRPARAGARSQTCEGRRVGTLPGIAGRAHAARAPAPR